MNGFRKGLGKFILSVKQPVGYNLQLKKSLNLRMQAVIPGTGKVTQQRSADWKTEICRKLLQCML